MSHTDDERDRARDLLRDLGMSDDTTGALDDDALDRLYSAARSLHGSLDPQVVLGRILDHAIAQTGADRGIVFRFEPRTGSSHVAQARGADPARLEAELEYSRTVIDRARALESVHAEDTGTDPELREADSVSLGEIASVIAIPLRSSEGVIGVLYLDSRTSGRPLSRRALRFATILAGLAGIAIENAERVASLSLSRDRMSRELARRDDFEEIVGRSRPMTDMLERVRRVGVTDFPVMLLGESGSGKELVAQAVHRLSPRREGPFIVQNCAAIPHELLESEFFGHVRGAYTGAHVSRDGLFRLADGGTLFLDEIADLDHGLQAKLLRVLEDGRIRPVGSRQEIEVDFRLVTATSTDVEKAVRDGRFRRDLYYRLNVVVVRIPPLRERPADVALLTRHFLDRFAGAAGGRHPRFSDDALRTLAAHPWPGNVRELEHLVKRVLVMTDGPVVSAADLEGLLETGDVEPTAELPVGRMTLAQMEEHAIREALRRTGGNKARAAEILGIHRNALLRRLAKMDD